MKTALMSAAAAALALALAGAAQAQTRIDPQWYVRADAGAALQGEFNTTPKIKGKTGWTGDLAVGRQIDDHFRAEGELIYSEADRKMDTGQIKVTAGLLNGLYDFDTGTSFRPYVGAGLGIGQVKLDGGAIHGDDTGFAYQLLTGVAYPINERLSAQVGYRYLGVNDVKIGPISGAASLRGDYHDQAVTAGLTYRFGG